MSLSDILGRCHEVGDCLLWSGKINGTGGPKISQCGKSLSARRLVWSLAHGKPVPSHFLLVTTCRDAACLNPAHLRLATRAGVGALAAAEGKFNSPRRIAAVVRGARKRAKLSPEAAREIRLSDDSTRALAARYGVARTAIRQVRAGKTWREAANGASVFNWRPAA